MKKLILSIAFLSLLASGARAGIILGTSNPPGTPLLMSPGTTSGPMLVDVVSDNPPNDIMAAWNFELTISPESGATGMLTFHDPTGTSAPNPTNYVFGSNGLGIALYPTNTSTVLGADDFFNPSVGMEAIVPGSPGANLLQMDFLASSNASGLFGVYAVEGAATTQWSDPNFNTQFFTNVPDGTGLVRIGDVLVQNAVPEPSSLGLLGLACAAITGWQCWSRRKQAPESVAGSAKGPQTRLHSADCAKRG